MAAKPPRNVAEAMVRWKWPTTHMVSCRYVSVEMVPRNRPVSPPSPKTKTVPSANSMGTVNCTEPCHNVRSQFTKSTTAGKLMANVNTSKSSPSIGLMPATYMWWP